MDEFQKYLDSGLAFRKGSRYYTMIGDDQVLIGQGKENAQERLEQLLEDGTLIDPSNGLQPSIEATIEPIKADPKPGNLPKILPRNTASKQRLTKEQLESLLGEIEDLKPTLAGSLDVYYNGVNMFDYHHPEVKAMGIILRWRSKQDRETGNLIIDDGNIKGKC